MHCKHSSHPRPGSQPQAQDHQQSHLVISSPRITGCTKVTTGRKESTAGQSAMSPKGDHSQNHNHDHHQQQEEDEEHHTNQNGEARAPQLPLRQHHQQLLQSEDDPFIRDTDSPPPADLHVDRHLLLAGDGAIGAADDGAAAIGPPAVISGHHLHHQRHHHSHHHHHHHHHRHHSHSPMHQQLLQLQSQSPQQENARLRSTHGPDRLSALSQDQLSLCYQKLHVSQRSSLVPNGKCKPSSSSSQRLDLNSDCRWSKLSLELLNRIFSYLPLADAYRSSLTCFSWSRVMRQEDGLFWERMCTQRITVSLLKSDVLSSVRSAKAKLRALAHAWNPADCSRNMYIKANGLTLHRNPVAQSTDAARGKVGYRRGRHCWEVWWEGPLGTVSMVGVCTRDQCMQASGYIPLLGSSCHSWGWNLVENQLVHDGESQGSYPLHNNAPKYQTGERIRLVLDCDRHTLSFEKNYEFLGVAFVGLPAKTLLFPAVSAVYGNTEVSMLYLGLPLDG